MGFAPTFYAGRPKLSEVTIDSDLNMGGRNISSVDTLQADTIGADTIDADTLRAGRVDSPYMPQVWATEELDWGDDPPSDPIPTPNPGAVFSTTTEVELFSLTTPAGDGRVWKLHFLNGGTWGDTPARVDVYVNGVSHASATFFTQHTVDLSFGAPANSAISIKAKVTGSSPQTGTVLAGTTLTNTGAYFGGKTFDLTGKWLAVGIDMHGLAATVKIQGVEIPYSDYAKYFPLAPTELTFPDGWDASQIRPVVEVYL